MAYHFDGLLMIEEGERGEGGGGRDEDVVVVEREGGKGLYSAPRG